MPDALITFDDTFCPLCGSEERTPFGRPRLSALFKDLQLKEIDESLVVGCKQCGLVYVSPMPNFQPALLKRMYVNGYFAEYTPSWERIRSKKNPRRRLLLSQKYAKRPIRKFLEVGCGVGYGLEAALRLQWSVVAQDVSPDFAAVVKKRLGIEVHVGPLLKDSFPTEHFDIIYMDSVLEHVPEPLEFMKKILGFLAPGGVLYLVLPNERSLANTLKDACYKLLGTSKTSRIAPYVEPYHVVGYSKPAVQELAKRFSLEMPYLECRRSYRHLEQYTVNDGWVKYLFRRLLGLFYLFTDLVDQGINLEVMLIKGQTEQRGRL